MNGRRAKMLRRMANHDTSQPRKYVPLEVQDHNGNPVKIETTNVSTGERRDYRLLKKWYKGEDVILPAHLQALVE